MVAERDESLAGVFAVARVGTMTRLFFVVAVLTGLEWGWSAVAAEPFASRVPTLGAPAMPGKRGMPRILPAGDRGFMADQGQPFVPMGVNYFRPGTGWAPQLWKQFDAEATRRDLVKLKEMGGNCVRVFLTFGSFYSEAGQLDGEGLAKFDRFLALAEEQGIYVHPTGPDRWEGLPVWARGDRYADEKVLGALEVFWRLLAARYRGRNALFAYDLLNEPEIPWDTPTLRERWNRWLAAKYPDLGGLQKAWGETNASWGLGNIPVPLRDAFPGRRLLDYQHFREQVAEDWTRRQVEAIRAADPLELVTVGLIQWSVPVVLGGPSQYSGFRPERLAPWLDFMEIHFYPLARGFYDYSLPEDEMRNLAYLECVTREVARFGKPAMIAEFGWYGGGKPTINEGKYPFASEQQQARWCRQLVESTAGLASGWLNWGFHDHPGARDVTEWIGLLTADGRVKEWGKEFRSLAGRWRDRGLPASRFRPRPAMDWDLLITDRKAMADYRERYLQAYREDMQPAAGK